MPVYSKIMSDNEILQKVVGKYNRVFLIACSGCMNESLAFDNGLPIFAQKGEQMVYPAIASECQRLTQMLEKHGIIAEYTVIPSGTNSRCIINLDEPHFPIEIYSKVEAVLVLACPSGFRDICKHTSVPSLMISEQIGSINYRYEEIDNCRKITTGKMTIFGD